MATTRTPAERVIRKFGTAYRLAKLLGIDKATVYKWTYLKQDHGGNGYDGIIPQSRHKEIFRVAKENNIELTIEDFSVCV